ncbi:MAG: SNF2-related protein [Gammaproteobacteria bacterium]
MLLDLNRFFDQTTIKRGAQYAADGRVHNIQNQAQSQDGHIHKISANVLGQRKYTVVVTIKGINADIKMSAECSCPVAYFCKHAAALLITAKSRPLIEAVSLPQLSGHALLTSIHGKINPQVPSHWNKHFETFNKLMNPPSKKRAAEEQNDIAYILSPDKRSRHTLLLRPKRGNRIPTGGFANLKNISSYLSPDEFNQFDSADTTILASLYGIRELSTFYGNGSEPFELDHLNHVALLKTIIETGHCYWETSTKKAIPLSLDANKEGTLSWHIEPNGYQTLLYQVEGKPVELYKVGNTLCAVNVKTKKVSYIDTRNADMIIHALKTPPISPNDIDSVSRAIQKIPSNHIIPALNKLDPIIIENAPFKRAVFLAAGYKENSELPDILADVTFIYGNDLVPWYSMRREIYDHSAKGWVKYERNIAEESTAIDQLLEQGFKPSLPLEKHDDELFFVLETDRKISSEEHEAQFANIFRTLVSMGWDVKLDENLEFDMNIENPNFYADITEKSEYGWFEFEIGIDIDGVKINILPTLIKYIEEDVSKKHDSIQIGLPDGRYAIIEIERFEKILNTLTELYDKNALNKDDHLLLSKQRAVFLNELKDSLGIEDKHWSGWEPLKKLNDVLSMEGNCILPVTIPNEFQGQLREYQQAGVNWLSFLTTYELGGILADDMGLGKTVQVLSYLLYLKNSGKLDKPCLVIVPTSLVNNWMSESNKFTPTLRILPFHGMSRKDNQNQFNHYDVILTTYPLMVHDQRIHMNQVFHTVILDEAQAIKNPEAQTTKIICDLQSSYRLCLTGTPMENHLGELWSLFNFLMPGFLGSKKQFGRVFRTPIEKQKNAERRTQLAARVKPFMLRRTKELVATELPPKIEMVQLLTLSPAQRDLYETIRLSMEVKVKQAITSKGFASSQIVILDALLKLRQVCNDPRVMKMKSAQTITTPDKLAWLLETLPTFIEEGRRILLFSSFKSVLDNIALSLTEHNYPFVMLTGQTKDRKTPVDSFQNKEIPIFLISLKAGGVGLNLTAADMIIHYDPWWNPAAQAQATDRAHRIGQEKTVFVYQLVAKDTVEEKILQMQENKAALLASIMTPESDMTTALTAQDVLTLFSGEKSLQAESVT